MSWMKRYGEVETLLWARHESFPREDTEVMRVIPGSIAFIRSYVRTSTSMYAAPDARVQSGRNCGWWKRGWLSSLPTTILRTDGNARATSAAQAANSAGAVGRSDSAFARVG